jgi:hypothetical protein
MIATIQAISVVLGLFSVLTAAAAGTIGANGEYGPGIAGIIISMILMGMALALMGLV